MDREIVLQAPLELHTQPAHLAPVVIEDPIPTTGSGDPLTIHHDPNERTLTIGTGSNRTCFYLNQMKLPSIKSNIVAFNYDVVESGHSTTVVRWKVKCQSVEEAKNLFDILAQYSAAPQRGEITRMRDAARGTNGFTYRWVA